MTVSAVVSGVDDDWSGIIWTSCTAPGWMLTLGVSTGFCHNALTWSVRKETSACSWLFFSCNDTFNSNILACFFWRDAFSSCSFLIRVDCWDSVSSRDLMCNERSFERVSIDNLVPRVLSLPWESTLVMAGHVSIHANYRRTEAGSATNFNFNFNFPAPPFDRISGIC